MKTTEWNIETKEFDNFLKNQCEYWGKRIEEIDDTDYDYLIDFYNMRCESKYRWMKEWVK